MNKERKKISPTTTAAIGSIITIIGGFLLSYNYIESKKIVAYDYMANMFYNGTEVIEVEPEEEVIPPIEEERTEEVTDEYIGYLTIPKINLTKVFVYNNLSNFPL